jgi:hypothetical protein
MNVATGAVVVVVSSDFGEMVVTVDFFWPSLGIVWRAGRKRANWPARGTTAIVTFCGSCLYPNEWKIQKQDGWCTAAFSYDDIHDALYLICTMY